MEWIILCGILLFVIYKVLKKDGNLEFWKLVQKQPQDAFQLFSQSAAWHIIGGDSSSGPLNKNNWDGPFIFRSPIGSVV